MSFRVLTGKCRFRVYGSGLKVQGLGVWAKLEVDLILSRVLS